MNQTATNPFLAIECWERIDTSDIWEYRFCDGTLLLVETGICGLTAFGHDDKTRMGCRMVHCRPNASGFNVPLSRELWVEGTKETALGKFLKEVA